MKKIACFTLVFALSTPMLANRTEKLKNIIQKREIAKEKRKSSKANPKDL